MNARLGGFVAGVLAFAAASAEAAAVYASNYDVRLEAEGEARQVRSRARVRDGHAIPVEFGRHKLDIHVSSTEGDRIEVELRLFEKSDDTWYSIDVEALSFVAQLGTPVEFTWSGAGIELDLALVVSVYRP